MIKPDMPNRQCAGMGDLFFMSPPTKTNNLRLKEMEAKKLCAICPHSEECLEYSLHHEEFGIWGGLNQRQRMAMRRELNIKLVRPEIDHIEELRLLTKQRASMKAGAGDVAS